MNLNNFLLSTDYPIDKIVAMFSGSVVAQNFPFGVVTIQHGLPFRPLCVTSWSFDSDFTVSRTNNSLFSPSGNVIFNVTTTDDSTITITGALTSSDTRTLYYRIYCLPRPGIDATIAPTSTLTNYPFTLNTDLNYMKLIDEGVKHMSGANPLQTVDHGLGFRPKVMVWNMNSHGEENLTHTMYLNYVPGRSFDNTVYVDESKISFRTDPGITETFDWTYKVYV